MKVKGSDCRRPLEVNRNRMCSGWGTIVPYSRLPCLEWVSYHNISPVVLLFSHSLSLSLSLSLAINQSINQSINFKTYCWNTWLSYWQKIHIKRYSTWAKPRLLSKIANLLIARTLHRLNFAYHITHSFETFSNLSTITYRLADHHLRQHHVPRHQRRVSRRHGHLLGHSPQPGGRNPHLVQPAGRGHRTVTGRQDDGR